MSRTIYTICWRDHTGHQQAGIYSCVYSSTCAAAPKSKWIRKWPTQTCTQSVVYLACCQHRDEDSLTLEWRRTTTWLWLARLACGGMTTMKGATVCDMYVHAQCIQLHILCIHTYSCVLTLMCVTRTITTWRRTLRRGVTHQKNTLIHKHKNLFAI